MSRDYITGSVRLHGGPAPGTGDEDIQLPETTDLLFGDNEELKFGDASDAVIKWDASNLTILPLTDLTGAVQIGNGTLSMDLKVFGTVAANYVEYDASADRLNVVVATRIVTGEEHCVDISYAGTIASGESMVGANVAVAPAGASGAWAAAYYGKVTVATGVVSGYFCGAELEVVVTGTQPCAYAVLVLNNTNSSSTPGSTEAFLHLRDYGSREMQNFIWFAEEDSTENYNSGRMLTETSDLEATHAVKCLVGSALTPVYLLATTTAPAA